CTAVRSFVHPRKKRPAGRLLRRSSVTSLALSADFVASSAAPLAFGTPLSGGIVVLTQLAYVQSKYACSELAALCVEMQWLAVMRYGVPSLCASLIKPPLHAAPPSGTTNSRWATARLTLSSGSGVCVTHMTSTRHEGVSFGFTLREASSSSSTSSTANDAVCVAPISSSRWIVSPHAAGVPSPPLGSTSSRPNAVVSLPP